MHREEFCTTLWLRQATAEADTLPRAEGRATVPSERVTQATAVPVNGGACAPASAALVASEALISRGTRG